MKNTLSAILLIIIFSGLFQYSRAQDHINFNAELLNSSKISFSELSKNKVTLISFWALWCKPCRNEMKALKELHDKYSAKGFQILGINQDSPRSMAKVESFVKSQGINFPIALDPEKSLFEKFNGQVIPFSLLYDKSGNLIHQSTGYLAGDEYELEAAINKALEKM